MDNQTSSIYYNGNRPLPGLPSMAKPFLDCTAEVTSVRAVPKNRWAWLAADILEEHWRLELDDDVLDEMHGLAAFILMNPHQEHQRRADEFRLTKCRRLILKMKNILDDGAGFAVLNRLPMDDYPLDAMVEVYWLLGQLVGRPVAQNWIGQVIYDVHDSGATYQYGVRGSHTTVELTFHTDNAFARMVPDYVGLLCRNTAKCGGASRICSLYTVHDRMQHRYPKQLARLYQPMYFDRQKEHYEGDAKVSLAPYFSWNGERLNARANTTLVRQGYEVAGEELDSDLVDALDAIDEVASSPEIWYEVPMARGDIQYLNNHEVGHYRSEFEDHEDADKKRHLFRLWHRERGSSSYDGGFPD